MGVGLGLRILCVEDDEDSRSALVFALEDEGYEVTVAETAEAGLDRLLHERYHLVLSDYALPGQSGTWMYEQASARGLLAELPFLFLSAHHDLAFPADAKHFRKPVDLEVLLREIESSLAPARNAEIEKKQNEMKEAFGRNDKAEGTARIELVLYISSASVASFKAVRNLHALLSRYEPTQVRFEIVDLSKGYSESALKDRIAFTPTLVKRSPEPPVWVLGSLENTDLVADLLGSARVELKR